MCLSSLLLLFGFVVFGFFGHINNGFEASSDLRLELSELEKRIEVNHGISGTCEGEFTLSSDCSSSSSPEILLWGDSFAMHLYHGINASTSALKLRQITTSACSPILGISQLNFSENKGYDWANRCIEFNDNAFRWLKTSKSVQFVVLSSPFDWIEKNDVIARDGTIYKPDIDLVLNKFRQTVKEIHNLGVGVVVVSPTPGNGKNIGSCVTNKYQFNSAKDCDFNYSETSYEYEYLRQVSNFAPV